MKAFVAATATSNRVTPDSALDRFCPALAAFTVARRYPKSKTSQENSKPSALPQTLWFEVLDKTGPEIGEITGCGRSRPKMLFRVARLPCHSASARGK